MHETSSLLRKLKKLFNQTNVQVMIAVMVTLLTWGGLMKAGYMVNFTGIDFLYAADGSNLRCPPGKVPRRSCGMLPSGEVCSELYCEYKNRPPIAYKPVIYLYPSQSQQVNVRLQYAGDLTVTYPAYRNGWQVIAAPNGTLRSLADDREYSYLFWEGRDDDASYDLSTGFVVQGAHTADFLQEKLAALGLTPREYNEFIVYWLPRMQDNPYNLIHFASKTEYDDRAVLDIEPPPDALLRVFMVFKKFDRPVEVIPQEIMPFERQGFTVVEWGGTEIE